MTARMSLVLVSLLVISTVWLSIPGSSAQNDESTATSAPSKTPEPTATALPVDETPEATEAPTDEAETDEARSYTQEDLSVLVGNVQRPNAIAWLNDSLYTVCSGDWTIYEINAQTGATITLVFGVQNAHSLVAEETEAGFNLWIPDFDTDSLKFVDQRRTAPETVASEHLNGPWGITSITEEFFLVSNIRSNDLVLVSRDGEERVIAEGFRSPTGLVSDGEYVYVANNGSARRAIEWFALDDLSLDDAEAEPVSEIGQPLVSGLQNASGMVLAPDGNLYFTYALGTRGVVGRVDPDECRAGGCTNEDVEIVLLTELQAPLAGLTISTDMRLFVHTIYRPEIYWVQLDSE